MFAYISFVPLCSTIASSFMSTVQFVSIGSFFTKISDPLIGGTYMTLLNTISNLGGTWPKYFILSSVQQYTISKCSIAFPDGTFSKCSNEIEISSCKSLNSTIIESLSSSKVLNGKCVILQDGYYIVGTACFVIGLMSLMLVIRPGIIHVEKLSDAVWRLPKPVKSRN